MDNLKTELEQIILEIQSIKDYDTLCSYAKKITDIDVIVDDCDITSNQIMLVKNFLCKVLMLQEKRLAPLLKYRPALNKILSKHLYNAEKLQKLIAKKANLDRNIGSIPEIFLDKVENLPEKVQQIYDFFADFSIKLNYDYDECEEEELETGLKNFEKGLSKIIKKDVKLEYVGCGFNGNGFKLCIENQNFFYKVFYLYNSNDMFRYLNHGGLAEPQMALFANKNAPKSKFAKFYFGRVAEGFRVDSFLVNEFLDKTPKRNAVPSLELDYINISQTELHKYDNTRDGKIVDFGGLRINIPEMNDKIVRRIVRIVLKSIALKNDKTNLRRLWKISELDSLIIKNLYGEYGRKNYNKAIDVIEKYFVGFPEKLVLFLRDVENISNIELEEIIKVQDIFVPQLETLVHKLEYYGLRIKTNSAPIKELNSLGNMIIDLNNDNQAICFYDSSNQIKRLRLEHLGQNNVVTKIDLLEEEFANLDEKMGLWELM